MKGDKTAIRSYKINAYNLRRRDKVMMMMHVICNIKTEY